jgi:hypothetical protein
MKNKKSIFLGLALILPVAIFIFLKLFGKNKFDIPVYYKNGVDSVCVTNKSRPFEVDNIVIKSIDWKNQPTLLTYTPSEKELENFKHVWQEIKTSEVTSVYLAADSTQWRDCLLLMRDPWKTVLVDTDRHIRGYYNLSSREETDRLIVELQILLEQY